MIIDNFIEKLFPANTTRISKGIVQDWDYRTGKYIEKETFEENPNSTWIAFRWLVKHCKWIRKSIEEDIINIVDNYHHWGMLHNHYIGHLEENGFFVNYTYSEETTCELEILK